MGEIRYQYEVGGPRGGGTRAGNVMNKKACPIVGATGSPTVQKP
jgi:hypothetical protein